VGGVDSQFLAMLQKRMLESQLPAPHALWSDLKLSPPDYRVVEEINSTE
jgi:hypothetical protein